VIASKANWSGVSGGPVNYVKHSRWSCMLKRKMSPLI
jgi:hypothetical protein